MSGFEIRAGISWASFRNMFRFAGLCSVYSRAMFSRSPLCKQEKVMNQNFRSVEAHCYNIIGTYYTEPQTVISDLHPEILLYHIKKF